MKQREPEEHGPAEEPGLGALPSRFRAPATGFHMTAQAPKDARTTGHLNTQPLEGDDS